MPKWVCGVLLQMYVSLFRGMDSLQDMLAREVDLKKITRVTTFWIQLF